MKKTILTIILCGIMVLGLTGCGKKTVISNSDFTIKAQENNYTVVDVTSQYSSYDVIEKATVAKSSDGWQVEFYTLKDKSEASKMFNTNKTKFEGYKGSTSTESSSSMSNYSKYSLTSNGYYMYLCRVDNTLLYVRVKDNYKSTVKDFIKELGY